MAGPVSLCSVERRFRKVPQIGVRGGQFPKTPHIVPLPIWRLEASGVETVRLLIDIIPKLACGEPCHHFERGLTIDLHPFPKEAEDLLAKTKSSPRLHAHLALVHDVACQLTTQIRGAWPDLPLEEEVEHLGAAIHDIGKTVHPQELTEPGHSHEPTGRRLLLEHGWPERLARFSVTHAGHFGVNDPLEDLLVAAADKVWKGKRDDALEQVLVHRIAALSGQEPWQVWMTLDDILTKLAEEAPERLRWQANHHV